LARTGEKKKKGHVASDSNEPSPPENATVGEGVKTPIPTPPKE